MIRVYQNRGGRMTNRELINIEKKYYNIILEVLQKSLGKIITDVNSQKRFSDLTKTAKSNPIESKAENTIENIISNQLNWDVCSLPVSSDSCYSCGDAIVHIDVKTTLNTDDDAPNRKNRLNIEASQTSYCYSKLYDVETPYSGRGKRPSPAKWKPKLKNYENHEYFGKVPNVTYFVRIIYSSENLIEEMYFLSVPNGQLCKRFGNEAILNGGKTKNKAQTHFTNIRVLPDKISQIDKWRDTLLYKRK